MSTFDLYYDPANARDPFTVARSGAREFGMSVIENITDNNWGVDETLSDEECERYAALAQENYPMTVSSPDTGEEEELPHEVGLAGYRAAMLYLRDAARREKQY